MTLNQPDPTDFEWLTSTLAGLPKAPGPYQVPCLPDQAVATSPETVARLVSTGCLRRGSWEVTPRGFPESLPAHVKFHKLAPGESKGLNIDVGCPSLLCGIAVFAEHECKIQVTCEYRGVFVAPLDATKLGKHGGRRMFPFGFLLKPHRSVVQVDNGQIPQDVHVDLWIVAVE